MLDKKVRNHKWQLSLFNNVYKPGLEDGESDVSDKEYGNSKHSDLNSQGKSKRSKKA